MFILKGQSNEIFGLPVFSSLEPAWATYHWVGENISHFGDDFAELIEFL